jgi:hypothetical protein
VHSYPVAGGRSHGGTRGGHTPSKFACRKDVGKSEFFEGIFFVLQKLYIPVLTPGGRDKFAYFFQLIFTIASLQWIFTTCGVSREYYSFR